MCVAQEPGTSNNTSTVGCTPARHSSTTRRARCAPAGARWNRGTRTAVAPRLGATASQHSSGRKDLCYHRAKKNLCYYSSFLRCYGRSDCSCYWSNVFLVIQRFLVKTTRSSEVLRSPTQRVGSPGRSTRSNRIGSSQKVSRDVRCWCCRCPRPQQKRVGVEGSFPKAAWSDC